MKKTLFLLACAFLCFVSYSQSVHKGSLLGLHTFPASSLRPEVTMEDFTKFYNTTVIPRFEKAFPGVKIYLVRSVRGADSSSLGVIYVFDTEADRNKYFNDDGSMTAMGKAANDKLMDLNNEFEKYMSSSNAPDKYNDWVVQ